MSSISKPGWGLLPGPTDRPPSWPWLHPPLNGTDLGGWITCQQHYGAWVHFGPGCSALHEQNCTFCEIGSAPAKFRWWVSLWIPEESTHGICEMGHLQIPPLQTAIRELGQLRGAWLCARRSTAARNSRIILTIQAGILEQIDLPPEPDLPAIIRRRLLKQEDQFRKGENDHG